MGINIVSWCRNTVTKTSMREQLISRQLIQYCFPDNSGEDDRRENWDTREIQTEEPKYSQGSRKWGKMTDTRRMSDRDDEQTKDDQLSLSACRLRKKNILDTLNVILQGILIVTHWLHHLKTWCNSAPCLHLGVKLHMIYVSRVTLRLSFRL